MLVLLPPSEGKASSGRGAPLKLETLSLPGLTEARAAILEELVELCAGDEEKAREVLGLSEGLRGEIAKNTELRTAGARPAGQIYTGVLYDALDLASLDAAAYAEDRRSSTSPSPAASVSTGAIGARQCAPSAPSPGSFTPIEQRYDGIRSSTRTAPHSPENTSSEARARLRAAASSVARPSASYSTPV